MPRGGFRRKGGGRRSCPPAEVLGSPAEPDHRGRACRKPGREAASALEVSPTDEGRRNTPASPFPHLITSHQHLELTTPREDPADTGRGNAGAARGRQGQAGRAVRPRQGPARQGQRRWPSFHPHRNSHTLRQASLFTRFSDTENEVQKGSKKIAHGLLELRLFWHPN